MKNSKKTIVGTIDSEVLQFTAGSDLVLDRELIEADCLGSAAHAIMLSKLKLPKPILKKEETTKIVKELYKIIEEAKSDKIKITPEDQDVHLAVERELTRRLGEIGRKIHTARSRNDQAALDLRIYARECLLEIMANILELAKALIVIGKRYKDAPMVGRTHLQPAMPNSVGVWATAYAESLLDDLLIIRTAYAYNNTSPLGSAAGYGVPLKIDRNLTAKLLGFDRPIHNVMYASNARGKCESVILSAIVQPMLSLSRLAEDLIIFSMPEFAYFSFPAEFCTGSSIMPQKKNPDVLELIRAKARRITGQMLEVISITTGLPGGYNRDLQETKEPFINGLATANACFSIMIKLLRGLKVNKEAMIKAFTPDVFATDKVLEMVANGMAFRDAYMKIKNELNCVGNHDPYKAIAAKKHLGATAGLDFTSYKRRTEDFDKWLKKENKKIKGLKYELIKIAAKS